MFDRLANIAMRFVELGEALATNEIAADPVKSIKLLRERAALQGVAEAYLRWQALLDQIAQTEQMASAEADADMRDLIGAELDDLSETRDSIEAELKELMIPKDPRDNNNCVVEIRAGTGGDEAGLFAGDLLKLYGRFCEKKGLQFEMLTNNETELGGFKEVVCFVQGPRAFATFKHESGTHRVQRIPTTEAQGRIHTSACTVAVLPEVEEVDVEIRDGDLRIDTYRASGSGGQHVNRTDSAVRITHLPTLTVVQCQDERSQHKNKARAMMQLRAKLFDQQQQAQHAQMAAARKDQVGSGDRSERIRTYNFPQNRLTDHRINLTLYNLDQIMQGDLEPVVTALLSHERAQLLAAESDHGGL
ncbi:MAG: peptide chain release factor 1 [Myxococcales bacterium]|nr:peptide chain release factor 1 [Myxococcales bacterium]